MIERNYTAQELAELFALNVEMIRREATRGNLMFIRIGKDLRSPRALWTSGASRSGNARREHPTPRQARIPGARGAVSRPEGADAAGGG